MTIDEVTAILKNHQKTLNVDKGIEFCQEIEALSIAINTMRKYQKIEEIVKSWRENGLDYDSCDAMENIERVVEDGNER